jgi:hypothetical protein
MLNCSTAKHYSPEFHPIFMTTGWGFEEFIYLLLFLHAMYLATIEIVITTIEIVMLYLIPTSGINYK